MTMRYLILISLAFVLLGCQAQGEVAVSESEPAVQEQAAVEVVATVAEPTEAPAATETAPPTPTDLPTTEATEEATAEPEAEIAEETPSRIVEIGRTEEGVYFIGAEDAPVTVIDYSDFL